MQNQGVIEVCPHCKGTGLCKSGKGIYACLTCSEKAGSKNGTTSDPVVCTVCDGKGKVWIGPLYIVGR